LLRLPEPRTKETEPLLVILFNPEERGGLLLQNPGRRRPHPLLVILFSPEERGGLILRNFSSLPTDYRASYTTMLTVSKFVNAPGYFIAISFERYCTVFS
jgi:hypothetical protein